MPVVADDLIPPGGPTAPPAHLALVTPSDSDDLEFTARAITIGAAGDVKVTTKGGETVIIPEGCIAPGVQFVGQFTRIWSTGTDTAVKDAGIIAQW